MNIVLRILLLTIISCATAPKLTTKAKAVVLMKGSEKHCKYLDDVLAFNWFSHSTKKLNNKILNKAAELGGNVAEPYDVFGGQHAHAKVYSCSNEYITKFREAMKKASE
jgi:hypothetical protein